MDERAEIAVRRYPYEEPHLIHLELSASNGSFSGTAEIYCNAEDLIEIAKGLRDFPKGINDQFVYEVGSEDPSLNFSQHFVFRAYIVDNVGHSAIQFVVKNNGAAPFEGACRFSIRADVASINRLGGDFEEFAKLESLEVRWTPRLAD